MDIASILGIGLSIFMILFSIFIGGSSFALYIDIPSALLVIIASLATSMLSVDMSVVRALPAALRKVWNKDKVNLQEIITQLVGFSESARKDGLLSLDDAVKDIEDPFLATGLRLMVDGTDPIIIKRILELELEQLDERHGKVASFFMAWGTFAPAYGAMGTVIGLIAMMANMADTASIGKGMALALITTLYGSLAANTFAFPLANKLAARHEQEVEIKSIMMEGILSIQSGENPRLLEQKLFSFLPPKNRPAAKDIE
jgi:chemotaxis protein MotA